MKILCLYNNDCALELFDWLEKEGHSVILCKDRLDSNWCTAEKFDLAVSYTYRYIISDKVIKSLNENVVNIHNSLLPFNRGADPNIWSIYDNTPKGVTLHYIDEQLDKGYIIAQEMVLIDGDDTLKGSYYKLDEAAKTMFKKAFKYYEFWPELRKKSIGIGSYHSVNDGVDLKSKIDTYDIKIDDFLLNNK